MPKLTYLGHSAFYLEGSKGRLVIDPFLSGNPLAKMKPADIKVDFVLLTHGHGDHIGDGVEIAKANKATIVAPFELANYCANLGTQVHPMHIGGGHNFPFGRVKLTIAHHGSAAPDGTYTGNPCGFLITMDGKVFYHTGDTGLFYDMKLIGEMNKIDVAVMPIGDNFTMGIDDAVKAAEFIQAKMVIPMHYKTFDVINVEPQEFVNKVKAKGLNSQILPIGETYTF
ncbi:MAG: metal-dependent hydrolase [Calditrichia bacterium]|jgi:L-ascorbate metabolism protein UlaG (beta-lactamase superfamily)